MVFASGTVYHPKRYFSPSAGLPGAEGAVEGLFHSRNDIFYHPRRTMGVGIRGGCLSTWYFLPSTGHESYFLAVFKAIRNGTLSHLQYGPSSDTVLPTTRRPTMGGRRARANLFTAEAVFFNICGECHVRAFGVDARRYARTIMHSSMHPHKLQARRNECLKTKCFECVRVWNS
jgi:hypothetical protein